MKLFLLVQLSVLVVPATGGFLSDRWSSLSQEPVSITIEELENQYPGVDPVTLGRFYSAFGDDSSDKLGHYLFWKDRHTVTWGADTDEDARWSLMVDQSIRYLNETDPELVTAELIAKPPKLSVVYSTAATDKDGNVLIQVFPKRMRIETDPVPVKLYTDALVSYLDVELETDDTFTLMIDFRQGRGWPNANYRSLLGAVNELAETVNNIHPHRIGHALGFPMPAEGRVIFQVWKPMVGGLEIPVILIPGDSASLHEPCPKEGLMEYIDEDIVDQTENRRVSLWIN